MSTNTNQIEEQLNDLRAKVTQLEVELERSRQVEPWQARRFYTAYYVVTGFMLGMVAALSSLMFNIVGSLLTNQHPLKLIQVYLTFPLGEKAFEPEMQGGLALAIGCCLYLGTGMLLGIPFQLVMARLNQETLTQRLIVGTVLGVVVWIVNFYVILSWLQPALFGGNWIVEMIPWWVGLLTHLVFGWTMALVYPLGTYSPYRLQTEQL
ncbi:MAG: hypothetical protein KDA38_04145 [Planctomycetales bacterium]|nr:hypothetical protein [Planctomycetales bacterium]